MFRDCAALCFSPVPHSLSWDQLSWDILHPLLFLCENQFLSPSPQKQRIKQNKTKKHQTKTTTTEEQKNRNAHLLWAPSLFLGAGLKEGTCSSSGDLRGWVCAKVKLNSGGGELGLFAIPSMVAPIPQKAVVCPMKISTATSSNLLPPSSLPHHFSSFFCQEGKCDWPRKDSVGKRGTLTKEGSMAEISTEIHACCSLCRVGSLCPVDTRKNDWYP